MRDIIIFDLDGTLVDSNAICVEILQQMLDEREAAITIDPVRAAPLMSRGGGAMVAALLGEACGDPERELGEFRDRYARRTTPVESLYEGVAKGIARLAHAGFGMAICSNKPDHLCRKVLRDIGLDCHFSAIVGGRAGLRPKPAPDLLDVVLAELGVRADRCLYVGDSELDHAIAHAAGMPFQFVTYGYALPGWDAGSDDRFDHFPALVDSLIRLRPEVRLGIVTAR